MNIENQLRLIQMRERCPNDEIYLVYDSQLLTVTSCELLRQFCLINTIIFKDIRTAIFPLCLSNLIENNLISIYEDEIAHLESGGNLAAASDVLRWLSPVYRLGVYTYFDIIVNTRRLPKTRCVGGTVLLNIASEIDEDNKINFRVNNDIVAVIDPASPYITAIQEEIIKANQPTEQKSITHISGLATTLPKTKLSPREYRQYICYVQKEFEDIILNRLSKKQNLSEKINLLDYHINMMEVLQEKYLYSVVETTGPSPVRRGLTSTQNELSQEELLKERTPLSLSSYYDVFCAFRSGQGGALHINKAAAERVNLERSKCKGSPCDLSWTASGEKLTHCREITLNKFSIKIQAITRGFFTRKHLKFESNESSTSALTKDRV